MKRLIESGVPVNLQDRVRRLSDCTCSSTCIAYYIICIAMRSQTFLLCALIEHKRSLGEAYMIELDKIKIIRGI